MQSWRNRPQGPDTGKPAATSRGIASAKDGFETTGNSSPPEREKPSIQVDPNLVNDVTEVVTSAFTFGAGGQDSLGSVIAEAAADIGAAAAVTNDSKENEGKRPVKNHRPT